MAKSRIIYLTLIVVLTGCTLASAQTIAPTPIDVPIVRLQSTTVPTLDRQLQAVPSPTPEPTELAEPSPTPVCPLSDDGGKTDYTVIVDMDYAEHFAAVKQTVRYTNLTGEPLPQIVFTIEANNWSGAFQLQTVTLDGVDAVYDLNVRHMTVNLPEPLQTGCAAQLELTFNIYVPPISGGLAAFRGFFGYSGRQINLGHWLPVISAHVNGQWVTHQIVFVGEQTSQESADWDVTVNLVGEVDSVEIAAPGAKTQLSQTSSRFVVAASRDFTMSLSPWFEIRRERVESGVLVELYYFGDTLVMVDEVYVDAAAHALDVAVSSFAMYEDLFGPYPYERIVIVQGDFPDGMEFSGLVFVSTLWFTGFPASERSYLTVITAHELSHQWWYLQVGNDSALHPWLDEALSTYSEYIFIEEYYPDLKEWWWNFRIDQHEPEGYVDGDVYSFAEIRPYINAVYLRGAQMMDAIRRDIGTDAFFDFLRRYAEAGNGQIATPDLFWSQMSPEQLELTRGTRDAFLREPDVSIGEP